MTQTVVGIFEDSRSAQNAFERLTSDGFTMQEVDITDQSNVDRQSNDLSKRDHSNDDFGDRVSRFFKNLFDDEEDAEKFTSAARTGTVVSVYADSMEKAQRAADILDSEGAINVNERFGGDQQTLRQGSMSEDGSNSRASRGVMAENEDTVSARQGFMSEDRGSSNRSIPVIEEEMNVGKRQVETGGMRVRSRIIDRPVEENLRLREERVTLERTPVNRPATESDLSTFRDGEIEVRERAEVPVVNKQARVVEEINVRKDVQERDEVVRDTVRKTEVEVDQLEGNKDLRESKDKSKRKI